MKLDSTAVVFVKNTVMLVLTFSVRSPINLLKRSEIDHI